MSAESRLQPEPFEAWVKRRGRADPEVLFKYGDYLKMRRVATGLLVAMTLLYLAASLVRSWSPLWDYVRAFAEASMVGACADWFAVVALFRKPLGLPIPHTGIVPGNKDRIGAALGRFMSNNFLSPAVLVRRLDGIDAASYAANWLTAPGNARGIADQASRFLPEALDALPKQGLVDALTQAALRGLDNVPASPLASRVLALIWARGETQALLDRAVDYGEATLTRNREFIRAKVSAKSSRLIPKWVDNMLADRVISGVQETLADMKRPDHPWRIDVKRTVETFIRDLDESPALRERGEVWKREILASRRFVTQLREVLTALETQAGESLSERQEAVAAGLEFALVSLGRWLGEDKAIAERLNRWARRAVVRAIVPRRADIGGYIASVVENWDSTTLVNRLELQVGKDLQYIRINGALVGGLAGLTIFTVSQWLPVL
jgi:uncharacterized membrane-anchored protein YjiN (DUF445 family)